jgi:hypothetical protein
MAALSTPRRYALRRTRRAPGFRPRRTTFRERSALRSASATASSCAVFMNGCRLMNSACSASVAPYGISSRVVAFRSTCGMGRGVAAAGRRRSANDATPAGPPS